MLLYDLVAAEREFSARGLPRIAAALLAWPQALPAPSAAGSRGVLAGAVLAAIQDVRRTVLDEEARAADDTATAAGSMSGTTSAMELLPGVVAAAQALCAMLPSPPHLAGQTGWPASRAAAAGTLAAAAQLQEGSEESQLDRRRCLCCALAVARACLGVEYCSEQVRGGFVFGLHVSLALPHAARHAYSPTVGPSRLFLCCRRLQRLAWP